MKPDPHDEQLSDSATPAGSDAADGLDACSLERAADQPDGEYRPRPHEHLVEPLFAGLETKGSASSRVGGADGTEQLAAESSKGLAEERPGILLQLWRALRGK